MNVKRKQAAVNKYAPMFSQGVTLEELGNLLADDEKQYTVDEIDEIRAAIVDGPTEKAESEKQSIIKPEEKRPIMYEQWRMELVNGKLEKLKMLRGNVKITEEEADILNAGATSPGAVNPIMYLKPE